MFYVEHSDETEKPHPVAKKKDDNAVDKKKEGGGGNAAVSKNNINRTHKKTIT